MSESSEITTTSTEQTEQPTTDVTETEQAAETPAEPESAEGAESEPTGREAAKYRRRLRDAESERDTVAATLAASQRAMIDVLAQGTGVRPAALWASGVELASLLDPDTSTVDPEKVKSACNEAVTTLGLSRTPRADPTQGGKGQPEPTGTEAFTAALRR